MGMGISGRRLWAQTGGAQTAAKAASGTKSTKGKYQIFQPGVYLDWEKAMVEDRIAAAKKVTEKRQPQCTGGE